MLAQPQSNSGPADAAADAAKFIGTIFAPDDTVIVRPVETWVEESGRKCSRVCYREIRYVQAAQLHRHMHSLAAMAAREHANLFFGVCPRQGGKGGFDLAWQIRTVRVLWADLDNSSVDEALKRCIAAKLPPPTVVISSGHGVHLYWLLQEPYLIDDAGDPPAVLLEWAEVAEGEKRPRPRKHILTDKCERLYLFLRDTKTGADSKVPNPDAPTASAKARHLQDILGGLAAAIKGDHTHDLARLLRLPGTMNRKNERGAAPPTPCTLTLCDPNRRYPVETFERFAAMSPARLTREAAAKVKLPTGRKLAGRRRDRLADLLDECAHAGDRSAADWKAVCWAISRGIDREDFWAEASSVGKFAERGRGYFDRTWVRASERVRERIYQRRQDAQSQSVSRPRQGSGWTEGDQEPTTLPLPQQGQQAETIPDCAGKFGNYVEELIEGKPKKSDQQPVTVAIKVGLSIQAVAAILDSITPGWPKRVGPALFTEDDDHKPAYLSTPAGLFAWIGRHLSGGDTNQLLWAQGADKVTREDFFAFLQQTAPNYESIEPYPHFPPLPGAYYMHPPVRGGDSKTLGTLLDFFSPATDIDRYLIQAFLMTLAWGGLPGQRPAFLVTSQLDGDTKGGRGVGKTRLAMLLAYVFGGYIATSDGEDINRLITRLLTKTARSKRLLLLDNLKTLRFSWAELEGLITAPVISGHEMFAGDGSRPNTLTCAMTINGGSFSRDMAQRTVILKLNRPEYGADWEDRVRDFIDEHRWELMGDLGALLQAPAKTLDRHNRWGSWERAVLSKVGEPSDCQTVIAERQGEMDNDQEEGDLVREAFAAELKLRGHDPRTGAVVIPASDAAQILNNATGERYATNRAGVYLKTLTVPELRKSDRKGQRCWVWRGEQSDPTATPTPLFPRPHPYQGT